MEQVEKTPDVRRKRSVTGVVKSVSGEKTVVVAVARRYMHATFKKYVTSVKKYTAHDEKCTSVVGDTVRIEESRPLSATKRWRVAATVRKAKGAE
jgi:small subunit ribosomal protein S17